MTADATIAFSTTRASSPGASLRARLAGYVVDLVIQAAFLMVFFVIAGFQLLASSDFGEQDPPEAAYWAFVSILMGTILFWSVFTLGIVLWRGQTAGQYVAGLRIRALDGRKPTFGQLLRWWFGLNPLFFNPLMMIPWLLLAAVAITRALSVAALATTGGLALLCLVAPLVALATALIGERRPLHDRLSGTTVVATE